MKQQINFFRVHREYRILIVVRTVNYADSFGKLPYFHNMPKIREIGLNFEPLRNIIVYQLSVIVGCQNVHSVSPVKK